MNPNPVAKTTKIVVASTVMLSFISFWRAAAIVLCDLASSSFYAGGIAEAAVGRSAPWFILGIMLFGYAIRAFYLESCSMFVRGGVYRVVHEAMGGTLAKFAVSALMFDYVLTGPISGVSAGLYLAGLINEIAELSGHHEFKVPAQGFAAMLAIVITIYFWWQNTIGMHESSTKALRIMQLTTIMVGMLIVWAIVTLFIKGAQPITYPTSENIKFGPNALGWLKHSSLPNIWPIAVMIGLGHSLLAMSGFETLAQVNREIADPKHENLKKAGNVIFVYSLVFTTLVSFLAVMFIPDKERTGIYIDNLISGIAMYLAGPLWARLGFHGFVVVVGTIILAGAVNTSMVGSNGVLNRVAEDGVLPDWFRKPHPKFGTSYRMINMVVVLQILTIILSRGDMVQLSEAYAFGVVWSFSMLALSLLLLRFKRPGGREYKVGWNVIVSGREIPIGLGLITAFLFLLALTNLFTKEIATVSGLLFTMIFYIMFHFSEKYNLRKNAGVVSGHEKFQVETQEEVSHIRPGCVLVPASNPNLLEHVRKAIDKTDVRRMDVVVLAVKFSKDELEADQMFSADTQGLFTQVVSLAEAAGKHVELVVIQAPHVTQSIVETAARLKASTVVMGSSGRMSIDEQAKHFGDQWEKLPEKLPMALQIVDRENGESKFFNLGPHPPRLWPEDVDLLHRLWLTMSSEQEGHKVHHRDVVSLALRRLERDAAKGEDFNSELQNLVDQPRESN